LYRNIKSEKIQRQINKERTILAFISLSNLVDNNHFLVSIGNKPLPVNNKVSSAKNIRSIGMANNNENEERLFLIWFDPSIGPRYDLQQTEQRLRLINDYILFFTDLDQCMKFIQLDDKEKIFLITSGSKASQILPCVTSLGQIHSIFIFSMDNNRYEDLINTYTKIIDTYFNLDKLCTSIKAQIELVNNQLQTFSFFDQHQNATKNLSKPSAEFLWFGAVHK
jgi:hypothetical protein